MNLSYWEHSSWLTDIDFTIVGSGIVGLSSALFIKENYPKAKVLVLERGFLPQGASTKNAGFACFGSISEILSDLKKHTEQEVVDLVRDRKQGIMLLREVLDDKELGYQQLGGHEVFLEKNKELYDECLKEVQYVNGLLEPVFGSHPFKENKNHFDFDKVEGSYITHQFEGQLDTGRMMVSLLRKCVERGVLLLNDITVQSVDDTGQDVAIATQHFEFKSKRALLATNGFAKQFLIEENIEPARAQVLITEPIPELHIKGTFHLDEGYYYFRNVGDRILLGGGRNLNFKGERTTELNETSQIQNALEDLLNEVILPNSDAKIAQRWSGIMGVGPQKKPIIKPITDRIYCGVRLGGMGVALGSLVGKRLAEISS